MVLLQTNYTARSIDAVQSMEVIEGAPPACTAGLFIAQPFEKR